MATIQGCVDLLTFLSALDQRIRFDAGIAQGWAFALQDLPDDVLLPAARDAVRAYEHGGSITAGMVEKHAQPYLRQIARDARSARLRGLVPQSWPDTMPLTQTVHDRLYAEFDDTNDQAYELGGPVSPDVAKRLGKLGKDGA